MPPRHDALLPAHQQATKFCATSIQTSQGALGEACAPARELSIRCRDALHACRAACMSSGFAEQQQQHVHGSESSLGATRLQSVEARMPPPIHLSHPITGVLPRSLLLLPLAWLSSVSLRRASSVMPQRWVQSHASRCGYVLDYFSRRLDGVFAHWTALCQSFGLHGGWMLQGLSKIMIAD